MSSQVKIEFVKLHGWINPEGYHVYHSEGHHLNYPLEQINGAMVPLWPHSWEQAGFGHGRFGYGSFGWGQGGLTQGGFGSGRFGSGEFGYYNDVSQWITPKRYNDGEHVFGVYLFGRNGLASHTLPSQTILLISQPAEPKILFFKEMTGGTLTVRWTRSEEL